MRELVTNSESISKVFLSSNKQFKSNMLIKKKKLNLMVLFIKKKKDCANNKK